MPATGPVRTLAVVCPQWSVYAAGHRPDEPVAVVHANRVLEVSTAAEAEGVVPGLRRRESQSRCPGLVVVDHDESRDARAFEAVLAAVGELTPRVEVRRPGRCALPTRGPSRYFGGDEALVDKVLSVVPVEMVAVGVADSPFAADLAALDAGPRGTRVVPPGRSPEFLAPLSAMTLLDSLGSSGGGGRGRGNSDADDLVGLFGRLGLSTLGAVAALPEADILGRFGRSGVLAHRLASGLDPHTPDLRPVPPDLEVVDEFDPPVERIETAAFRSLALAEELDERVSALGLACTRVVIEAETEHGEIRSRVWRHDGPMRPRDVADRIRWQLDGWLLGPPGTGPTGPLARIRLVPDEVIADKGRQLGFWGGEAEIDDRVQRAAARLQGILGHDAVTVPELRGGRSPGDQVALVPVGSVELRPDRSLDGPGRDAPWPGRLPTPSPALMAGVVAPRWVRILDADGTEIGVDARGVLNAEPVIAELDGVAHTVVGWAGPWPVDETWWDRARRRRRARLQLLLDNGTALLVAVESRRWTCEALYA